MTDSYRFLMHISIMENRFKKKEYLSPDDSEVVKLVESNHITVIRRYKENEYFALFVLENQSKVDYGMVIRVLHYISLLYERELRKASPNNYTPKGTKTTYGACHRFIYR